MVAVVRAHNVLIAGYSQSPDRQLANRGTPPTPDEPRANIPNFKGPANKGLFKELLGFSDLYSLID